MNKTELEAAIAERAEISLKDARAAVRACTAVITEQLANNESVSLLGFGTFEVRTRKERKGVNPQNKKPITIPAGKIAAFKAGKSLKDAVKGVKKVAAPKKPAKKAETKKTEVKKPAAKKTVAKKPAAKKPAAKKTTAKRK